MTYFLILNPDQRYPYQLDLMDNSHTGAEDIKDKLREQKIPSSSEKYLANQGMEYQVMRHTFETSFSFDPAKRLIPSILLNILETEFTKEISFVQLSNSQSTALEIADMQIAENSKRNICPPFIIPNDGTNACAFLSLGIIDKFYNKREVDESCPSEIETIINEFPVHFNPFRDISKLYDIYESNTILTNAGLLEHEFAFTEDFLVKKEIFTTDLYITLDKDLSELKQRNVISYVLQYFKSMCISLQ